MRGITKIGLFAAAALICDGAHAQLYFPAAIAAGYDVLICAAAECSFEHPERADYTGTLMLFEKPLDAAQLVLPGERQYISAAMGASSANACFALSRQGGGADYVWSRGLTTWGGEGATIYLNLGSGVDAGYAAKLAQAHGDGLAGTASAWGVGVAAPDDLRLQTVVARRRGRPDLSACPTASTMPDPDATRRAVITRQLNAIDERYTAAVAAALNASGDPRDQAAATLFERDDATRQSPERSAKLARAMRDSRDPLVYWIALHDSHKSWIDDAPEDAAMRALPRIEPDNIAVWVEPLSAAVKRNDEAAVTAYLGRMAAATHYDEHAAPILAVVLAAYRRTPVPPDYVRTGSALIAHLDAQSAPYYLAALRDLMGGGSRLNAGLPGLRELSVACRAARTPRFDAVRTMLCAHIARTLTQHSTSFSEGNAGFDLLRELEVHDAADLALARRQRWLVDGLGALYLDASRPDAIVNRQFIDDLISGVSEEVAIRRALRRAGKADEPPADYPELVHPFLGERIAAIDHRVFGRLSGWLAQLTVPPGVQVLDIE